MSEEQKSAQVAPEVHIYTRNSRSGFSVNALTNANS